MDALPPRQLTVEEASGLRSARDLAALTEAMGQTESTVLNTPAVLVIGRVITASKAEEVTAWMATA